MTPDPKPPVPDPAVSALGGTCPRCGRGKLFRGPISFADRCSACGLDFTQFNVGDGPAAFLILVVGTIVTVGALLVDAAYEPPAWVHLVWVPIALALTAGGLRVSKGLLLAQEYRYKAREGRIAS